MRIGMMVWTYWPEPEGGAERQCRLLVRELTGRGHACVVFASRAAQRPSRLPPSSDRWAVHRFGWLCPLEKKVRRRLSRLTSLGAGDPSRWRDAAGFWLSVPFVWASRLSFIVALFLFARRTKTPPVDLLHVHESGWLAGVGVVLARHWNIPVLCKEATTPPLAPISHGTPFRRGLDRKRYSADGWLVQTPAVREQLGRRGLPPDRIHLLPNGVIVPKECADPARSDRVLYVGNLSQGAEWKAFDVLFDAWTRVAKQRPSARLCFVGAGDPGPWMRLLRRDGVGETVHFAGRVEDPSSYYRTAGIFLLPSRIEGMSNALLEAQSWGLPCVVSGIPGNAAVVKDDVNGLVVPVGEAEALSAAVLRLMDCPDLRVRLGREARIKMEQEHDIARVAETLARLYGSLTEPGIA